MTARPGEIVAWWDGEAIAIGYVAGEEKQRLRLVRSRGRDERVNPARVATVVDHGGAAPGADRSGWIRIREQVAALEARLRRQSQAVDVPVLWEIAGETGDGALAVEQMAELALDSRSGEACAVVLLALVADGLHFVRKGQSWMPREPEAVEALRAERAALARRDADKREFLSGLAAAAASGGYRETGTEPERRALEALEQLALHADRAPDAARALALETLEAARVKFTRPHEGAFRLLRRMGRFDSDDENLQVHRFELRTSFPDEVLEHARRASERGFDRDGRRDLTGMPAWSIDGPHTREIDDLLSVEPRDGGGYRLAVHIADPAAFVEVGDPVDREALARGLTHYMPDLRLPMLPPTISEQAASLAEGVERPALSFLIELDGRGEIAGSEMVRSIVRSDGRLTYTAADRRIADGDRQLGRLAEVGRLRREARARAGALTIVAPEVDVHVDRGQPTLERIPAESPSRWAVAESMVLVGQIAAAFCVQEGLPAIYRRQPPPAERPPVPADGVWDPVRVRRTRRSLRRAETGLEPGAHSGLGLEAYVQASSPLRRYQDLTLQRQLLARLRGEPPCHDVEAVRRIASTTERAEADARRAEEAADEYWLLRYLEGQVGRQVEGTVVETDPRVVVQLDETLRDQPVRGLAGVEPGRRLTLTVVRVDPRAGLLSLRPAD